jgi:hypothetical protein
MVKILDYYFLVLWRWFERMAQEALGPMYKKNIRYSFATDAMALFLVINLFSLAILFVPNVVSKYSFLIIFPIVIILDKIYNKERRERIKKEYYRESGESRQRGACKVICYVILSIAFLIFAFWFSK